jgi:hypothetical protein
MTSKSTKVSIANQKSSLTRGIIISTVVAGLLLVIANSALWINHTMFNSDRFADVAGTAVLSESSRHAIASEIVNKTLADRPLTRAVVGDQATKLIAGLIDSNQARSSIDRVVTRMHMYITSRNPANVELSLIGIKSTVGRVIQIVGNDDMGARVDAVPDTLTIVDASKIPSFYQFAVAFLWAGPVALIAALVLLIRPHLVRRRADMQILAFQSAAVITASLAALLAGPLFRPPLLALVSEPNYRTVIQNLYDALNATFITQTYWLLFVGVVAAMIPLSWYVYGILAQRFAPKRP